jgi:gliding motility-associated-like protein
MSPGIDPNTCGGLSTVFSGNFSARLGNDNVGAQAEGLSFPIFVTPQSTLVQYAYAVVFEDPGHTIDEQPRFNSRVRLADGSIIQCTDYMVTASSNLPGFQSCPGIDNQGNPVNIAWRDWSTVSVDLSAYVGQTVTLEFETGDCSLGGHYGYAYIDAIGCSPLEFNVQYCVDQTFATVSAPSGFTSYLWETGSTLQSVNVNPLAYDSISCFMTTATGCQLTLTTALEPTIVTPSFTYVGECTGQFLFTNTSTITNGSGTYNWNFGDNSTSSLTNPTHTYNSPGVYTITLSITSDNGCQNITSQSVEVFPIPITDFLTQDNCLGDITIFSNISQISPIYPVQYLWIFGDNTSSNSYSPIHIYQNPGTYNVTLITTIIGTNCGDSVTKVVHIRENPIINISSNDVCQGNPTIFTNTANSPNWSTSMQYLWTFGEFGSTSLLPSPTYTYLTEGQYVTSLLLTATDGNLSCSSILSDTSLVYPNPGVSFIVSNSACIYDTISFTNLSTISPTSQIINYTWNFGDNTSSNVPNPTHTYLLSGTYNITLTATSNYGCVQSSQNQIVLHSLPIITSTNDTICRNEYATLSANGGINYTWTPSTTLNTNTGTYVLANPQQSTFYTVTGTDINGCSSTSQSIVIVNPIPNIIVNSDSVCQGESVVLNAYGANTYTWFPSINLNTSIGPNVICTPNSPISYTVTGTDINGCVGTSISNVGLLPVPNLSVNSGIICEGESINLTANGANTYYWYPSSYLNTSIGQSVISTPSSTVTYSIIGVNSSFCRDTIQTTVTVNPLSNVSFTPELGAGCPPLTIDYTSLSTGNIISWFWNFGDGSYSTQENPQHIYETTGNYSVSLEVTTNSGCVSSYGLSNIITVYPTPISMFSVNPDVMDELKPVILTNNFSIGAINYFWNFGDNHFSNLFNTSHSYDNAGSYIVTLDVQNQYGCLDESMKYVIVNPIFTYYIPNAFTPSRDNKNEVFFGKGTNFTSVTMQIFDRWGIMIYEQTSNEGPLSIKPFWDGTINGVECQIDVYVYQFFVTDIFGEVHLYRGRVSLIR